MSWPRFCFWHEKYLEQKKREADANNHEKIEAEKAEKRRLEAARMTSSAGLKPV